MAHKLILLVSLTGLASGIPLIVGPQSGTPESEQVQYSVQLVPFPPRTEFGSPDPPPVYLPVQQQVPNVQVQPHAYPTHQQTFPNRIIDPTHVQSQHVPPPALQQPIHTLGQPTVQIPSQEPLQPLGQLPHQVTTYQPQVQDAPLLTTPAYQNLQPHQAGHQPPSYQHLPPHQAEAGHHHPPPAPGGSTSAYVATLSYGPGHPTVVYSCYIPGRHPPPTTTTSSATILKGHNGYHCAVSYYHNNPEKRPQLSDQDFYDKK